MQFFTFSVPLSRLLNNELGLPAGFRNMQLKITSSEITNQQPKDKVYEVTDTILPGFRLRIQPSGHKSFLIRYRLPNGKVDRVTIGNASIISVAKARDEAKRILGQVTMGINPKQISVSVASLPTLKDFIEKEYIPWSKTHHQWSKDQIQRLLRMTEFLSVPIHEITPHLVEKWRAKRLSAGTSPNTVNRDVTVLKSAISKAVEWGILKEHPCDKLKPLKIDRSPNIRYLTNDEEIRLRLALDAREKRMAKERQSANAWRSARNYDLLPAITEQPFADYLKPLVLLSLNTGARQGELLRLQWDDIDFDRKSLALVMRGKRKSYTRHIPLNKEAYDTLVAWRDMQAEIGKLVFPSKNGERFDNIQTSWENLRKDAKIDNFRWHDMRHHFASRLVMNGVPLNTVRELLGHTSVEMTLRYAHLAPEQKERAVATLDRVL